MIIGKAGGRLALRRIIYLSFVLAAIYGCGLEVAAPEEEKPQATVESLGRTIGEVCELVGYENVRVQGHSLVVGLNGTGSRECPPLTCQYILKQLRRLEPQRYLGPKYVGMTAEELLESRDTAVVEVTGYVPAGAPKGTIFDVEVRVVRATQTTSLQGGYLLDSDMQIVVSGHRGPPLSGRSVALAAGPIFVNPFPLAEGRRGRREEASDPRKGVVVGGGRSLVDREVKLSIMQPSYRLAQQIQRRINGRFSEDETQRVADATRSLVRLRIPASYRGRYQDFFRVLRVLYLSDSKGYLELKLRELTELAGEEGADYEGIASAWEGIGRTAQLSLAGLYEEQRGEVGFYAARTAARLGDRKAIDALAAMALDEENAIQLKAAKALGEVATDVRSRAALGQLLDKKRVRARLLGYDGLRRGGDKRIASAELPGGFRLESVGGEGENILCVWVRQEPRIVLLGKDIRCGQNAFYESGDGQILVNIGAEATTATLTRELAGGESFITCESSLDVKDLITIMALPIQPSGARQRGGLGLSFSEIVGVLYGLCDETRQIVPARFVLHRTADDLLE